MSLINASYFYGNLQIAQLNQKSVTDSLQWFIDTYEPEFLQYVLGLQLYEAFIAGLAEDPIDSKWLFLRDGGNFTGWNGYLKKWVGLATGSTFNPMVSPASEVVVPVNGYAGTNILTYAPLAGASYYVERRGFGTAIEGVDIAISNNRQTWTLLQDGDVFEPDEVWIAHITKSAAGTPSSGAQPSPISAYVYYHYMRDLQTQSMGVGETKATSQNAMMASASEKCCVAWNKMSEQIKILYEYLDINNNDLYPEWTYGSQSKRCGGYFDKINIFGI